MPRLRVEPSGLELDVEPGDTAFQAAARVGATWPNVCGGQGLCRTCWFEVLSGEEHLAPAQTREVEALRLLAPTLGTSRPVRLACQAAILGDLIVRKMGVRPPAGDAEP